MPKTMGSAVVGCEKPVFFGKPPIQRHGQRARVGAKRRVRTRRKERTQATRGETTRDAGRNDPRRGEERPATLGAIAPNPPLSPDAVADKKAPPLVAGHRCPLPPTTVAGVRP